MVSVLSQFDGAIDRTAKLVTLNWSEQLKVRKAPDPTVRLFVFSSEELKKHQTRQQCKSWPG